jgi:hypothetical protein
MSTVPNDLQLGYNHVAEMQLSFNVTVNSTIIFSMLQEIYIPYKSEQVRCAYFDRLPFRSM